MNLAEEAHLERQRGTTATPHTTQARQSVKTILFFFFLTVLAALSPVEEIVSLGWYHYYTTVLLAGKATTEILPLPFPSSVILSIRLNPSPTSPFVLSSSPSSFHLSLALLLLFPSLFLTSSPPPSSKVSIPLFQTEVPLSSTARSLFLPFRY